MDQLYAPKAWAHGVGYVLPRIIGALGFGAAAMTLKHPTTITVFILLP